MTQPLLQLIGIEKSFFSVPVLKGINLDVLPGSTVGLVGENGAGKSTLMNLLGGNLRPDAGQMQLGGRDYAPHSPRDAAKQGVAFVHQELNLFPNLSIAENLFLTSFPSTFAVIHRAAMNRLAAELLDQVGLELRPETLVEKLSAGQRQLVEVAAALRHDPRLIIWDEPTTSLSSRESERLFALIAELQGRGVSMIYISHALGDVMKLCDRIVVLRDGEVVASGERQRFTTESMIAMMVGREIEQLFPPRRPAPTTGTVVLRASGVTHEPLVRDISLAVGEGEILGISGLMGSGRTELARVLFGLDPMTSGEIWLAGQRIEHLPTSRRIALGMAMLTESRRDDGLCMEASIAENLMLVAAPRFADNPLGWMNFAGMRRATQTIRQSVRLTASARDDQSVKTLSGGNQQKVVLGKWLLNEPKLLILDEPTRGIDVGAKYEIYCLIQQLAARGAAVLMISSEIEELVGLCDRILVMNQGQIRDEIHCDAFDRQRILRASLHDGHVPGVEV